MSALALLPQRTPRQQALCEERSRVALMVMRMLAQEPSAWDELPLPFRYMVLRHCIEAHRLYH
jgi:hypothetical protein